MANKSISQLDAGAAVSSTDLFPDVQTAGVGPVKVTAAQIGNYVLGGSGLTGVLPVIRGGTGVTTSTGTGSVVLNTTPTFTTSALFPAGTVSAPGISVSGDTNTGIYFPAADTIGFVEGGVESMRLDASGNLGVGTSSPGYRLDVTTNVAAIARLASTAGDNTQLIFRGSTTNANLIGIGTNIADNGTGANFDIWNYTTSSNLLRVTSSGNLLVGTITTRNRLTVAGSANVSAPTLGTASGTAFFCGTDASYGLMVGQSGSGNPWLQAQRVDGTATAYDIVMQPSGGNVGIGTTTPQFRFNAVQNNGSSTPSLRESIQVYAKGYGGSSTTYSGIGFAMHEHTNGYWGSGILARDDTGSYGSALAFYTSSGSATPTPSERMRIDSSGNLLIGTTTSLARLTVSTTGSSDALSITGSNQNGFRLRSASGGAGLVVGRSISSDNVNNFFIYDEAGASTMLLISNNGYLNCPGVYNNAAAASNAVNVTPSGDIYRSTSSRKYKEDIQDASFSLGDVLKLRPITYVSKNTEISGDRRFGGLIAEEVDEAGLGVFVEYAPDGSPDNIHYGNMVSLAFKAIQELAAKVSALEAKQ